MGNVGTTANNWHCGQCGKEIPAGYAHVCVSNNYYYQCPPPSSPAQKPVYALSDQGEELLKRLDALLILTAALNNFAAAMNAAAEASSSFSFSVSNNCALVVEEVDDEHTH